MRQPSAKNVRGMTLIELIFAIAIGSILRAVSLPAFGSRIRRGQSRSASEKLIHVGLMHDGMVIASTAGRRRVTDCDDGPPQAPISPSPSATGVVQRAPTPW